MNLYQWTPQGDTTVRAEHRDLDRVVFLDEPAAPAWSPACRYPKRWSRAKRKEARAREMRAIDRAVARALAVVRKFRRAP